MVWRNYLATCLALLGLTSLSYLFGAAAIFFDLPSSPFLRRAFVGGVNWYEHKSTTPPPAESWSLPTVGHFNKTGKTSGGYTLCMYGSDSHAVLIDMGGKVVHQWHVPFSQVWRGPPHVRGRVEDASVTFNGGHLYPNGDLLVVLEGPVNLHNSSHGYGLLKLDKDSNVLWKYAERCHHAVDVGEDGTIYTLVAEAVDEVPPALAYIPTPCMVDFVDVISPQGERKKRIALLEAIQNSPYSALLCALERPRRPSGFGAAASWTPFGDDERRRDVLHANAVTVLSKKLASKFPMFKAGQLLVSLRRLDAIAVLDPDSGKVVWATCGSWRAQHDPTFLENGRLLLFDNLGAPSGSRVLEYDPQTQAFPWTYPGESNKPFLSKVRGMCQRLPDGNTLIVNSDDSEVFEVTPNREIVWSCSFGRAELYRASRYAREQVPFLRKDQYVRP